MDARPAIVIIPARGGSRGIPGKNLQLVGARSLIERAVDAAVGAGLSAATIVSTDDDRIRAVAAAAGALTLERPIELAGHKASSESAVAHALDGLPGLGLRAPAVTVLVQCTSPFVSSADIDAVISPVANGEADSCFTGTPDHRFVWELDPAGTVNPVAHDPRHRLPRQLLPARFAESGAAYAFRTDLFRQTGSRFVGRTTVAVVDPDRSIEIDDPHDLLVARTLADQAHGGAVLSLPSGTKALVMDFDGVFTDNAVTVDSDGKESVRANRSDGLGLSMLQRDGRIKLLVLSTEENPVVARRCEKLQIELVQGLSDKRAVLAEWLARHGIHPGETIYVGNDVNDLGCMGLVGCSLAPSDAHPDVLAVVSGVLRHRGGDGALREVTDGLLARLEGRTAEVELRSGRM